MSTVPVGRAALLRTAGRLGWGVADQGVSSVKNFVLGVFVATTLGAQSLGALGLVLVTYAIVLQAARGLATDPLMVRYTGTEPRTWRSSSAAATATATVVGIVAGAACLAGGAVLTRWVSGEGGAAFTALAPCLPLLALQDSYRYAFFAAGRGGAACATDLVWAVSLVLLLPLGAPLGHDGIAWAVVAFGASAGLSAAFAAWRARTLPDPRRVVWWWREHHDLGTRFLGENVTLGVGQQVTVLVVAAVAGLGALGAVRGAEMLIGPVASLLMGISQVAVPEAVRARANGRSSLERLCRALSGGLAAVALLWGALVFVVLPHGLGDRLLGEVWPSAHSLLPAVIIGATAGCLHVGPSAGLRALGRADLTLRMQVLVTSTYAVLGTAGAAAGGAGGMVWGTATASCLGAVAWWLALDRAARAALPLPPATALVEPEEVDDRVG